MATVTIDRPEKRNAMTFAVLAEFEEAIRTAGSDDAVRAVVVTGAGGAFCAGTDLADLAETPGDERLGRRRARSAPRATTMVGGGRRGRSSPVPSR